MPGLSGHYRKGMGQRACRKDLAGSEGEADRIFGKHVGETPKSEKRAAENVGRVSPVDDLAAAEQRNIEA